MDAFRDTFTVVPAQLGDNATVMGAAAWQEASEKEATPKVQEGSGKKESAKS
jgi:hypothetical protein